MLPLKVVPLTPVPLLQLQLNRQTSCDGTNSWWYDDLAVAITATTVAKGVDTADSVPAVAAHSPLLHPHVPALKARALHQLSLALAAGAAAAVAAFSAAAFSASFSA